MTTYEEVALELNRDILTARPEQRSRHHRHHLSALPDESRGLPGTDQATSRTKYNMPIVYFTQLLGLALGFEPDELLLDKLFVGPTGSRPG